VTASKDPAVDVSYGVGAFLLAASEVLKLPDADLATLEDVASRPVNRALLGRTWLVALPGGCDRPEVVLTNAGASLVHARLESGSGTLAGSESADVAPGGAVILGIVRVAAEDAPSVFTLRADGDLAVQPRAVCEAVIGVDGGAEPFLRPRSKRAGIAVPLSTALAVGEATTLAQRNDGFLALGGKNTSPDSGSMVVEIHAAGWNLIEWFTLELPSGGAVLETRFVPAGSSVILSNASEGAALVPLRFGLAQPR